MGNHTHPRQLVLNFPNPSRRRTTYTRTPIALRFWPKVDKSGECWLWMGTVVAESGYGTIWCSETQSNRGAHRVAWELENGPIPDGMWVLHRCEGRYPPGDITYRRCVRPSHLKVGTCLQNAADRKASGRECAGDRHLVRLHPELAPRVSMEKRARGSRHGHAKLTEDQVRSIRVERATGKSLMRIATDYAVSKRAIQFILQGKHWAHI